METEAKAARGSLVGGALYRCTSCKELIPKIPVPKKYKGYGERIFWAYLDGSGKRWRGTVCYRCELNTRRKKYNGKSDEECSATHRNGRWAEKTAKRIFELCGYVVSRGGAQGADLKIERNGVILTVEVKCVTDYRNDKKCGRVTEKRSADDLICFITKDKEFFVDTMKDHLNCSGQDGVRSLTQIFRKGAFLTIPEASV